MSLSITAKRTINSSVAAVARIMFDPQNDPIWIGGITEASFLNPPPLRVGSQVKRRARFLGKTIDYVLEVVRFEPDALIEMRSVVSPFPMVVTYRLEPLDAGMTAAAITVQGSPKSLYNIADFLMAPIVLRNVSGDLKRLQRLLNT